MAIPRRRERLPHVRLFSGPFLAALLVLAVLIVSIIFLKRRARITEAPIDTLVVSVEGMSIGGKALRMEELYARYIGEKEPRRLQVVVGEEVPFGQTWNLRDTLALLDSLKPDLTILGLE